MVVGDVEAKEIDETPIAETGVVEQDGIGGGRLAIGIPLIIASVTLAPHNVLMKPTTPLLAILEHSCNIVLSRLSHGMPEKTFSPLPAFRLQMKVGVEPLFPMLVWLKLSRRNLLVLHKCQPRRLLLNNILINLLRNLQIPRIWQIRILRREILQLSAMQALPRRLMILPSIKDVAIKKARI